MPPRRKVAQGASLAAAGLSSLLASVGDVPPAQSANQKLIGALEVLAPRDVEYEKFPQDPVKFINDVLGYRLWSKQEEIVYSVWENRYTSVASCHGIGKSVVSSAIVVTFLNLKPNSMVISTAPTGRQVEHILWRNIRHMYKHAKVPLLGRPPLTTRYDIAENWFAMGFKPQDAETDPLQGFHAVEILAVIDEAAGVAPTIIDGTMAAMTTDKARMLMIGNPTSTSGPFYDSHHANSDMFKTFVIAWPDTPNYKLKPGDPRMIEGLIDHQWVDDVRKKYGEDSAYFQSRVNAEWVSAEDVLIPLAMIEAAEDATPSEVEDSEVKQAGFDVARDGKDKSVLTLRHGSKVIDTLELMATSVDFFAQASEVLSIIDDKLPDCQEIKIDEIGLGAGMVDVLSQVVEEQNRDLMVIGVNFSRRPHDPEQYLNQRSEAYGELYQRFRNRTIHGKIHKGVKADLSDLRFKFGARVTQPVIEAKDEFRKRTGHSPDHADSFALAFYNPPPLDPAEIGVLAFGYAQQKWGKT